MATELPTGHLHQLKAGPT